MKKIIVLSLALALVSSLLCACDVDEFRFALNEDGTGYILEKYNETSDSSKDEVIIPDSYEGLPVVEIEDGAFSMHTSLKSVVIPEGVEVIGCHAFGGCTQLTDVTIPRSVKNIADQAFEDCTGLTEIIVPQAVNIGWDAFKGCRSLTKVSFGMEAGGGSYSISHSAFKDCSSLEVAEFGPCYREVGDYAFSGCYNLSDLSFSCGLKEVKSHAFQDCKALDKIYYRGTEAEMNTINKWPWWNLDAGLCNWETKPFPEIVPGLSIMEIINSEHAWTSEGGFHNPYDRFYFDCENMIFKFIFESPTYPEYNTSVEYKMTIIDERTIRIEGFRDRMEYPAEITIVNENRLWIRFIDDENNTGGFLNKVIE